MINLKPERKKVFIINKSSHDYSGAEKFGNLVFMTEGSIDKFATSKMFRQFEGYMSRSKETDYILLSGLTVMCSVACAMFSAKHKRLNLLIYKWDDVKASNYVERTIMIGGGEHGYENVQKDNGPARGRSKHSHNAGNYHEIS